MDKAIVSGGEKVYSSSINPIQTFKKKKTYTYHGKKLYSKLVPSGSNYYRGLQDDYPRENLIGHFVACFTRKWENDVDYLYGYFDSYVEFYEYYLKFFPKDRCFYEIVNFYQKPHFDIDIKCKKLIELYLFDRPNVTYEECKQISDYLVETLIKSCKILFLPNELSLNKDILIYTSHDEYKLSYHIIIDHWSHFDNIEAKAFFDKVSKMTQCFLNGKYCEFLDERVYSENQAFRLVGSHKVDNNRVKTFQPSFMYQGKMITHEFDHVEEKLIKLHQFSRSLITYTSGCQLLQSFKVDKVYKMVEQYDLCESDVNEISVLLADKFKNQFIMRQVKKNQIELSKRSPYYCQLCQRVHQHENPRIVVYYGCVYWQCRRTFEKLILGYLSSYSKEKMEIINEGPDDTGNFLSFGDFKVDLTQDDSNYIYPNENEKINIEYENYENEKIKNEKDEKIKNENVKNENIKNENVKNEENVKSEKYTRTSRRMMGNSVIKKEKNPMDVLQSIKSPKREYSSKGAFKTLL